MTINKKDQMTDDKPPSYGNSTETIFFASASLYLTVPDYVFRLVVPTDSATTYEPT
jgi:hypothetical protein